MALLLCSTSDVLRIITDSAASLDTTAHFLDLDGTTVTPGNYTASPAGAGTTTVCPAPAGTAKRNCTLLTIANRHASLSCTVTLQLYNGATAYQIDARVLVPGQTLTLQDGVVFVSPSNQGLLSRPWYGRVAGACVANAHPGEQFTHMQRAGNISATATNISTSVARCSLFILPFDLTVNRIRFYGLGSTTALHRVAIYRLSDLARLTAELAFNTAAATWGSAGSSLNLALTKDVPYFIATSVNSTGTTAALGCIGGTVAAATGQVATNPSALPGNLAIGSSAWIDQYYFQFAVSTGALPATAASLVAQAAWTGGMPAFWLDNSDS